MRSLSFHGSRVVNHAERLDDGFRCMDRFAAAREEVRRERAAAAAAAAADPSTTAPSKKLRAKQQAALAAIEAGAEQEFQARYDDQQNEMFARLSISEYYGSEGFDHPPSDVYSYGGGYFGDDGAGA